jgi:hypothetical protein
LGLNMLEEHLLTKPWSRERLPLEFGHFLVRVPIARRANRE